MNENTDSGKTHIAGTATIGGGNAVHRVYYSEIAANGVMGIRAGGRLVAAHTECGQVAGRGLTRRNTPNAPAEVEVTCRKCLVADAKRAVA